MLATSQPLNERIDGLIAAMSRAQNGERTDDDRRPRVPPWLTRRFFRHIVSQLYHGERASHAVCTRLIREIDDLRAQRFLEKQIADEHRHAALYRDYLNDLGGVSAIDPGLARAQDAIAAWTGTWHGPMVAVNTVLESEAVRTLQSAPRLFACPRLAAINRGIVRDEARHLAFGRLFFARTPAHHRCNRAARHLSVGARPLARLYRRSSGHHRALRDGSATGFRQTLGAAKSRPHPPRPDRVGRDRPA